MNRAALYIRVSTDEQVQHGTSLKSQREALESYCKREGIEIAGVYQDDGYSGGSIDRPAFQRLMREADQGKFNLILVHRLDRFSRSLGDAPHLIIRHFGDRGISFKSITENFDSATPSGRMMLGTLAGFADFERERIMERSREGRIKKAKMGYWMMSFTPFGYVSDENKRVVIEKKEASIYKKMVQWVLDGTSSQGVARKLNAMNIPTKHTIYSKKKKKFIWKAGTVYGIMTRPLYYKGEIIQLGIPTKIFPLISKSQWDRVQAQFKSNFNLANRNTKRFYLLKGLIKCKKCGRNMVGLIKENRGMRLYYCMSKRDDPFPRFCGMKNVPIDKLDLHVWQTVRDLIKDSKKLREAIERSRMTQAKDLVTLEAQQKWITKQVRGKDIEIDRILGLYGKTRSLSVEDLDKQIGRLKDERKLIEEDLRGIEEKVKAVQDAESQAKSVQSWAKIIASRVDRLSQKRRRELLLAMIRKIHVDWDEKEQTHYIDIEGAVPIFDEPRQVNPGVLPPSHCFKIPSEIV